MEVRGVEGVCGVEIEVRGVRGVGVEMEVRGVRGVEGVREVEIEV